MQAGGPFSFGSEPLHNYPALPSWVGTTIGWTVVLAALWKGGRSERVAIAGFVFAWLATPLLRSPEIEAPPWSNLAVDTIFLAILVWLALRSRRWWPLVAAALELLSVFTHIARLIDPGVRTWAYFTADIIWTYLLLGTIAVGTLNHWRARRQLAAIGAPAIEDPGATRR